MPSNTLARMALVAVLCNPVSAILYNNFQNKGCFGSLDNWQEISSDSQNTPGNCGSVCQNQNKPLFALSGTTCYCGSEVPSGSKSSDSGSCSSKCSYDPEHSCGGDGAFVVYLIDGETAATASDSDSSSTSSSSKAAPSTHSSSAAASTPQTTSSSAASSTAAPGSSAAATASSTEASSAATFSQSQQLRPWVHWCSAS